MVEIFNRIYKKIFDSGHEKEVAEIKQEILLQSFKTDIAFQRANSGLNIVIHDINKAVGGKWYILL